MLRQPIKTTMTSYYPGIHMTSSSENKTCQTGYTNHDIIHLIIREINTITYDVSDVNLFPPP